MSDTLERDRQTDRQTELTPLPPSLHRFQTQQHSAVIAHHCNIKTTEFNQQTRLVLFPRYYYTTLYVNINAI